MRKGAYVAAKVTATGMSFMLPTSRTAEFGSMGGGRLRVLGLVCVAGQGEQHWGQLWGAVCMNTNLSPLWCFGDGDSSCAVVWVGCAEAAMSHR